MSIETPPAHQVRRVRNETRRRLLSVSAITRLSPGMLRLEFESPDLHDFASLSPDDHVKLFIPDASSPKGAAARDYTPRAFDAAAGRLTIDFALHPSGAATDWARNAKTGDHLEIGGPRGSQILPDDFDHYLLVGDATAIPSIARRCEELRADASVLALLIVDDEEDRLPLRVGSRSEVRWVFRNAAPSDDATLLRTALESWDPPAGDAYVWIAAEATVARALKNYMLDVRGHRREWLKAAGYWVRGKAGESEKFDAS